MTAEPISLEPPGLSFAALDHDPFRWFIGIYVLAMMADNVEQFIGYRIGLTPIVAVGHVS